MSASSAVNVLLWVIFDVFNGDCRLVDVRFAPKAPNRGRARSVALGPPPAADLPVYKRDRSSSPAVLCNGGLHFHAVLLVPPRSRLNGSVEEHFRSSRDLYRGSAEGDRHHPRSAGGG